MPILLGMQALYSLLIFLRLLSCVSSQSLLTVCVMVVLALESDQGSDLSRTCGWLLFTKFWVARVEPKMSSLTLWAFLWAQSRPSSLITSQACGSNFKCPDGGEISYRVLCHTYSHKITKLCHSLQYSPLLSIRFDQDTSCYWMFNADTDSWPKITVATKCEYKRSLMDWSALSYWWWSSSKGPNCVHWPVTRSTQLQVSSSYLGFLGKSLFIYPALWWISQVWVHAEKPGSCLPEEIPNLDIPYFHCHKDL